MVASNSADNGSSATASPESHPPSLLCSSSSTPHSPEQQFAVGEQQRGDHPHRQLADQQPNEAQPAVVCDDASYFDGDWVSNTVQSAVTHFFGSDRADGDDDESQAAVASESVVCDQEEEEEDEELNFSIGPLSPSAASLVVTSARGGHGSATSETNSITDNSRNNNNSNNNRAHPTIDTSAHNEPLPLTSKARSLSPSFSLFAPNPGCAAGIYERLHCDSDSALGDDGTIRTDGQSAATASSMGYQPHFSPADFTPQTWANVLRDASTIRYCGAGAAVLTAVIVIHPLALIGAAATAAVSATAMWAVGFFHDLDKGYQIWSEEFGILFWEDNGDDDAGAAGARGSGGGGARAAKATSGSRQIIQKDEEHLRRVFLLEQERRKMGEKVWVVKVEESTGELHEVKSESAGEEEEEREGDDCVGQIRTSSIKSNKDGAGLRLPSTQHPKKGYRLRRIKSAPVKSKLAEKGDSGRPPPTEKPMRAMATVKPKIKNQIAKKTLAVPNAILSATGLVDSHFPPLEICVVQGVELPGLNTAEFFRVFFADDAPYSMRDFQKKRGDVDIVYSRWEPCSEGEEDDEGGRLYSLKKGGTTADPLPRNSTQERKLKFNTLTKSYFGPAYAKAIKTQRATQLSDKVLVIENITQLMDIPFSDRFRVVERWVVEAVKNNTLKHPTTARDDDENNNEKAEMDDALYTCKLGVHAEVEMLKNCSWEAQIRKKASETFTEVATEWCKSATVALRATEEQKRKRLRHNSIGGDGEGGNVIGNASRMGIGGSASNGGSMQPKPPPATPSARESELFAKHRRNFQELDKHITKGDLEWCSIEVMHSSSSKAGAGGGGQSPSFFAQVLEYPSMTEISSSMTGSTTDDDGEIMMDGTGRKGPTMMMRRKSRKLFKRLSSRVNKSKQQQPR